MSLWTRIRNVFRPDELSREIEEEIQLHVEEAIARGREPVEARRALGSALRYAEDSRDIRLIAWLDSLRADAIFGWRQLIKRKTTSAAAVLSLGLALGACASAFRLIDALLWRPLPVKNPERLYYLYRQGIGFDGRVQTFDGWAYPAFRLMRAAVKDQAELVAVSYAERMDVTHQSQHEIEKASVQYVSGWMFPAFGLEPAAGRLFTEADDSRPGAHPYAVLSYDYWSHRFARDAHVVGHTFRMGERVYEIVGVGPERFTGTETGIVTDIFLPAMMHPGAVRDDTTWHRTLALLKPGVPLEPVRARLHATSRGFELERAKGFTGMTRKSIDRFIDQTVMLGPASSGASGLQSDYRVGLAAIGLLVMLVLLIACANVANLMTAQAAARMREMALRVSIGAGRWRLVQLVLVESAWLALLAAGVGAWLALWSAPFVVSRIRPADNPARLFLAADWRVLAFGIALTASTMLLFGLAPALRASSIRPARALKGGEEPRSRRRTLHALIAVQVAFCFLVVFAAGLFAATFERLSNRPLGFSPDRILTLQTVAERPQPMAFWDQTAEHLRTVPGVEAVALADRPLLDGYGSNSFISVNGAPPTEVLAYFRNVSPGWTSTMKITFLDGRDFREADSNPGAAIVSEAFAKQYFNGEDPVGRFFERSARGARYQVVGLVRDAPYRNLHEPILPVAYVPFHAVDAAGVIQPVREATFIVRTASSNPLALAPTLRREVPQARPEFRVSNVHTQTELIQAQTLRERLLAMLAVFFAGVALLLAAVGLYGVLDYSVIQRRREIGIRMAIGAGAGDIARRVTADVSMMVLAGSIAGLALGIASVRYIEGLLFQVKSHDPAMLALPAITIFAAALAASLPAVRNALRTDPVPMLRGE